MHVPNVVIGVSAGKSVSITWSMNFRDSIKTCCALNSVRAGVSLIQSVKYDCLQLSQTPIDYKGQLNSSLSQILFPILHYLLHS